MNIRMYNARILTMEKGRDIFFGEIWIKNDKIVSVVTREEVEQGWDKVLMPRIAWDIEIDCEENLLMPGFKDCHTHSAMTFLRSYADDLPLDKWLHKKVFPMEEKLTSEDIYHFTRLAIMEYVAGGITSIGDMYLRPEETARACMDMGMRCTLISGLNNFTSSIEQVEKEYKELNRIHPLISYEMGFHAEYTCDKELLVRLSELAHKYKAPIYTHLSETQKEVEDCLDQYGLTPTAFLDGLGIFDYGGGGYHCVHMTTSDMEILKKKKVYVITNPASNAKLASGMAPINAFLEMEIPVAIGTDGAASNNCLDMFREMFLVTGLSKLREEDAAVVDALDVLEMATSVGAGALRKKNAMTLAKGNLADMIMIDLNRPNMKPLHNIRKNIVYSGNQSNVKMTMIGGKILYMDGKYNLGDSPENVYGECEKRVKRLEM